MPTGITPKIACTIPVTSFQCKKSVSALKWLKTVRRANTMQPTACDMVLYMDLVDRSVNVLYLRTLSPFEKHFI